jgi:hypothetical protein
MTDIISRDKQNCSLSNSTKAEKIIDIDDLICIFLTEGMNG